MAEDQQDSGEKEFEASEQRRQQARREGNVAQSKEVNAFALLVGLLVGYFVYQGYSGGKMFNRLSALLAHSDGVAIDVFSEGGVDTQRLLVELSLAFVPLFLCLFVFVLTALVLQRAVTFSVKKIEPKPGNLSPVANLKKRYGGRGWLDFIRDAAKMLIAGLISGTFLFSFAYHSFSSSFIHASQIAEYSGQKVVWLLLYFIIFQLVLALIDLPLQRSLNAERLRMTRQEMKKEHKQNEGDPQLKQSRREKASKISRGQMLENVKSSTVVMVNPEHYAIGLKWDAESDRAPVCVAKGVDHLAARLRELAILNDIPVYPDPPTTRSIYKLVDIDEEIHPVHFAAVAAAIQFVERARQASQSGSSD